MTCSRCCTTYALQRHIKDHGKGYEDVQEFVERAFCVDNCLQSLDSLEKARNLIDRMCSLLSSGGFEIRQWASNVPAVSQLKPELLVQNCGFLKVILTHMIQH